MINHYNAFISYKHAELDSKIAEHIQYKLEHFGIPSEIKKKYGIKKIERVFRDKDELPITSSLTDTITSALENSDYLIVICTSNTKKSVWVEREITTFLKTHDRSQVFTVLGEGEPYEVIPEVLLYEEETALDSEGNEVTIKREIEPLSCDYRGGLRKGYKEEFPRLASAVIGCSYDELMNRRRQYRTRRMIVVFSLVVAALVVLGSYFYLTNKRIKESLQLAQERQARYLAAESERLNNDDHRIKAIQVALLALPNGSNPDIPVIPSAQRALTDAVGAYVTMGNVNVGPVWEYDMNCEVSIFASSESGNYIASSDIAQNVKVWETETHKELCILSSFYENIEFITFVGDEYVLITSANHVYSYEIKSNKIIWDFDLDELDFYGLIVTEPVVSSDKSIIYIAASSGGALTLNVKDGSICKRFMPEKKEEFAYVAVQGMILSPDESKFACVIATTGSLKLSICDIGTGTYKAITEIPNSNSFDVMWIDNDNIILQTVSYNMSVNLHYTSFFLDNSEVIVKRINLDTMEVKWEDKFVYSYPDIYYYLYPVPSRNAVCAFAGGELRLYSLTDGEVLSEFHGGANILLVKEGKNSHNLNILMSNGNYAVITKDYSPTESSVYKFFPTDIICSRFVGDDIYIVREWGTDIINYRFDVYDNDWNEVTESMPKKEDFLEHPFISDDYVLVVDGDNNLLIIDPTDNSTKSVSLNHEFIDGDISGIVRIAGIYDDKAYIEYSGVIANAVFEVDLKKAKIDVVYCSEFHDYGCSSLSLDGDSVLYLCADDNYELRLCLHNITKGKDKYYDIEGYDNLMMTPTYFDNAGTIVYQSEDGKIEFINAKSGKSKYAELPEGWQDVVASAEDSEGNIYLADISQIAVFNPQGKLLNTIKSDAGRILGIDFITSSDDEDIMLVAYSAGYLYRYSADDYSVIGSSQITVNVDSVQDAKFIYDSRNDILLIQQGDNLSLIELTEWYELAVIPDIVGYNAKTNRLYTYSNESSTFKISYYEQYTIEDLIDKAYEILGDKELSYEEKIAYGVTLEG